MPRGCGVKSRHDRAKRRNTRWAVCYNRCMLESFPLVCEKCDDEFDEMQLIRCPICHKRVCSSCRRNKGGKEFCSQYCAEFFFHYEEED